MQKNHAGLKCYLLVLTAIFPDIPDAAQYTCKPVSRVVMNGDGFHAQKPSNGGLFVFDTTSHTLSTIWDGGTAWSTKLYIDDPDSSEGTQIYARKPLDDLSFRISFFPSVSPEVTFSYDLRGTYYFGYCEKHDG